jgi:calcineurin-like phosphoesterase family protein
VNRIFVIADLHFSHAKLAEVRGFASTQAHDDFLVAAWNRVVNSRDVVYVLGDVFRLERVPELRGTKKLALGNHDQRPATVYAGLFSQVRACFEFDGCLLTHIPVHPCQFGRFELNVHGHMHAQHIDDDRYVPVSVEHCGPRMEPLPLRELIQARRGSQS